MGNCFYLEFLELEFLIRIWLEFSRKRQEHEMKISRLIRFLKFSEITFNLQYLT